MDDIGTYVVDSDLTEEPAAPIYKLQNLARYMTE